MNITLSMPLLITELHLLPCSGNVLNTLDKVEVKSCFICRDFVIMLGTVSAYDFYLRVIKDF